MNIQMTKSNQKKMLFPYLNQPRSMQSYRMIAGKCFLIYFDAAATIFKNKQFKIETFIDNAVG